MADENNTGNNTEVTETSAPAETAQPKRGRRPRQQKATSEASAAAPEASAAPVGRGRRKRTGKPAQIKAAELKEVVAKTKAKGKAAGKGRTTNQATKAPAPILDDIADLLQLEQENAHLRKALADKLRAENADLRKRLGLA